MADAADRTVGAGDDPSSLDRTAWSNARTTLAARWLLLATAFAPFLFVRGVYFPYVTSRALLFRLLVGLAGLVFLWQALVRDVEVGDGRDPLLWALIAWAGVGLLAAFFSPATHHALFGGMERMWGVTQWVHLLLFYFLARVYFGGAWWARFLRTTLLVSVAVGLYGLGQLVVAHGVGPWWSAPVLGSAPTNVASTLGNTGYLSIYGLVHVAVAGIVWARSGGGWRAFAALAAVVNAVSVVLGGSRAATVGAIAGVLLAAALWAWTAWRRGAVSGGRLAAGAGGVVLAVAAARGLGLLPPLAELPLVGRLAGLSEGTAVIRRRLLAWEAGWEGVLARPLTGWGVENFHLVFQRFGDPEFYRTGQPFNWDRAHNVLVGSLAGAGALGALAYGAFWVAAGDRVRRAWKDRALAPGPAALITLGVAGSFVYLLFWFEDHNSFFVLLALLAWARFETAGGPVLRLGAVREAGAARRRRLRVGVLGALVVAGGLHAVRTFEVARAARLVSLARNARSAEAAVERFETAGELDVPQHRDVAIQYADFVRRSGRGAYESLRRGRGGELFVRAVVGAETAVNRALHRTPGDGVLLLSRSYVGIGAYMGTRSAEAYDLAVESVEEAIRIAPDRLHYYLALASHQSAAGQPTEAIATLDRGIGRYAAFARLYRYRSRAHGEAGRPGPAYRDLRRSLWLEGEERGTDEIRRTAEAEAAAGRPSRAADLLADWAAARYYPGLWSELDRPDRRAFLREVGLADRIDSGRNRGYVIDGGELYLFVLWHRWARAAGDTAGARLAVETALEGLSGTQRTERLRPTLRTLLPAGGSEAP